MTLVSYNFNILSMNNIVLIGMPASGKSTAGVLLAKKLGYDYIDCDLLIQRRENAVISELLKNNGVRGFIEIEEDVNSSVIADKSVISTGGSVIYGEKAMEHLAVIGKIVYLKVGLSELEKRLSGKDLFLRGVVMKGNVHNLAELYSERVPLYEKYAQLTVDCDNLSLDETVDAIICAIILQSPSYFQ